MFRIKRKISIYVVNVFLMTLLAGCIPSSSVFISFNTNEKDLDILLNALCNSFLNIGFSSGQGCPNTSSEEEIDERSWVHYPVFEYSDNRKIQVEMKYKKASSLVHLTYTEVESREFGSQALNILKQVKSALDDEMVEYDID